MASINKHGCFNRKLADSYDAQKGSLPVTLPGNPDAYLVRIHTRVHDVMSRDCRYSKDTPNDIRCTGCKHHPNTPQPKEVQA